jgi:hypothetical protein
MGPSIMGSKGSRFVSKARQKDGRYQSAPACMPPRRPGRGIANSDASRESTKLKRLGNAGSFLHSPRDIVIMRSHGPRLRE